jgi:hypothetical protein
LGGHAHVATIPRRRRFSVLDGPGPRPTMFPMIGLQADNPLHADHFVNIRGLPGATTLQTQCQ